VVSAARGIGPKNGAVLAQEVTSLDREGEVHPQLQAIVDEFEAARARLHELVRRTPEPQWHKRADPDRWSMAECVAHLNLTSEAFVPLIQAALEEGRQSRRPAPRRYRRDPVGWLLWRMAGPPVRHRVKTTTPFIPRGQLPLVQLLAEFDRLQQVQIACVGAADGVDLGRLWIRSPFNPRIRYNTFSCLSILPRHQHRHLWQAEQVWSREG
jgi:DinB superfamily